MPGSPCHHTLNKGILILPHSPCPYSIISLPIPLHLVGQSADCLTPFGYLPHVSSQGNTISLTRGRSPSVNDNTHIPEDRPRGPCTLVSLTSLMNSLDHLRGVLSASRDGCFSRARLQLHHHTIEIRTRYWYVHYLVEEPDVS